jgi:hypothetical protein
MGQSSYGTKETGNLRGFSTKKQGASAGGQKEVLPTKAEQASQGAVQPGTGPEYSETASSIVEAVGGAGTEQLRTLVDPGERVDYANMSFEEMQGLASESNLGRVVGTGKQRYNIDDTGNISGVRGDYDNRYMSALASAGGENAEAYGSAQQAYESKYKQMSDWYRKNKKWSNRTKAKAEAGAAREYQRSLQSAGIQPGQTAAQMFKEQGIGNQLLQQEWTGKLEQKQDQVFSKFDEDTQYNQALKAKIAEQFGFENQLMTESPEYIQMQEAIAEQRKLVETQAEQMDWIKGQYGQLQQDYEARDTELTGYLEGLGETERRELNRQRQQMKAGQKEDLMRRGMTSSSALNAALRGVDRTSNEGLGALEERLRKEKMTWRAQFSGETLGAQQQALSFAERGAQAQMEAGTTVPQTMAQLAQMLSDQRVAKEQQQTGLIGAALGAEASRFGAAQSAAASRYASMMGYKSDVAAVNQRDRQAGLDAATSKYKIDQDTKLGYSNLQNQLSLQQMQNRGQVAANNALPGKTFMDLVSAGKVKTRRR